MSGDKVTFTVDGIEIEAAAGQTIIQACDVAGVYIPRLCYHPDLEPAGHCRVCTCKVNGRRSSTCTMPAAAGMVVENNAPELNKVRRKVLNRYPELPPLDFAVGDQLVHDASGHVNGDGEANTDIAAQWSNHRSVDSHGFAVEIDESSARIPRIDRGVGLDEVLIPPRCRGQCGRARSQCRT